MILPLVLAFIFAITWTLEFTGRARGGPISDPLRYHIGLYVNAALFIACLGVGLWNTLRWGKEAEEYETDLKKADEIEKERRRKSTWIER